MARDIREGIKRRRKLEGEHKREGQQRYACIQVNECGSVEVTEASRLASFLHQGAKLELLPGQKAYML